MHKLNNFIMLTIESKFRIFLLCYSKNRSISLYFSLSHFEMVLNSMTLDMLCIREVTTGRDLKGMKQGEEEII